MNAAGTEIHSRFLVTNVITTGDDVAQWLGIQPPRNNATYDAGAAVLKNYQEYDMINCKLTYTPAVGSTTPGQMWFGYYDNPEIIYVALSGSYSPTQLLLLAQCSPDSYSTPVWQPIELPTPMRKRRSRLAVDTTSVTSNERADMTTHGIWIVASVGAPEVTLLGSITMDYSARGFTLQNQSITVI
jgi:hypothetical protein